MTSEEPVDYRKDWIRVHEAVPVEGVTVDTKIDDAKGCRNEQPLTRRGGLWFFPDGSMYVYYTPTHWKERSKDDYFSGFDSIG